MSLNKPHHKPRRTDKVNNSGLILNSEKYVDFKIEQLAKKYGIEYKKYYFYQKYNTRSERDNARNSTLTDVICKNPMELKTIVEIQENLASYSLCYRAVIKDSNSLEYVPRYHRTKEMCTIALCFADKEKRGNISELVPTKLIAEEGKNIKELVDFYDGKKDIKELSDNQFKTHTDYCLTLLIAQFKNTPIKEIRENLGCIDGSMSIFDYCEKRYEDLQNKNENN